MSKFIKASIRSIIKFLVISLLFNSFVSFLAKAKETKNETCGFKNTQSIYLFSGTIAASVYRLGLYQDPQIKGMMGMYQFKPTTKKIFSGGIYLSQKLAEEMDANALIFHEESHDLETTLNQVNTRLKKKWTIHKLYTLHKSPAALSLESLEFISNFLKDNESCRELIAKHKTQIAQYQKIVESKFAANKKPPLVYFFMGKWQGDIPEAKALVIYQEGFVQQFLKYKIIAPYDEHELKMNYTPWSAKKFFKEEAIYVGIVSELDDHEQNGELVKVKENRYQSYCFGCLIPGIFQMEWMSKIQLSPIN